MKRRIIFTIACLLWTTLSFAQWMPDSTVQVVAYWELGDVMPYQFKAKTVQTDKDGNETVVKSSSEKRIFEIIDKTDDSYVIQTRYADVFDSEMSLSMGIDAAVLNALSEAIVLKTKTDEYGSIIGVVDAEESKEHFDKIVELSIDATLSKYSKKELKQLGLSRDELANNFKQLFAGEEMLNLTMMNDVAPLLQYHGGRYNINDLYSIEQEIDTPFGASVEGELLFEVNMEISDDEFVAINSYLEIPAEAMAPFVLEATITAMKQTMSGDLFDQAEQLLRDEIESTHMSASIKQYTTTLIHVQTGWPMLWTYDRELTISTDNGIERIITESQEIEMIVDEEDGDEHIVTVYEH